MKLPRPDGFSLVEVVLAIGVAAFALVPIFGLLPIGTSSNESAIRQCGAARIATSVVSDLRATALPAPGVSKYQSPQFGFDPTSTNLQTIFLNKDGEVNSTGASALYRATIWCTPPLTGSRNATAVRLLITWPAAADSTVGVAPSKYNGSFETSTALDRN